MECFHAKGLCSIICSCQVMKETNNVGALRYKVSASVSSIIIMSNEVEALTFHVPTFAMHFK